MHEDLPTGAAREVTPVVRAPVVEVTEESTLVAARRLDESAASAGPARKPLRPIDGALRGRRTLGA